MRRVSIGLELVGAPDVVLLDEPTSGLDAVSAANVAKVLRGVANGSAASASSFGSEEGPHPVYDGDPSSTKTAVIATIHQPSSGLYRLFDRVAVLAHGRALYVGEGGMAPVRTLQGRGVGVGGADNIRNTPASPHTSHEWTEGYNVADWLLEVASEEQWRGEEGRSGDASLEKVGSDAAGSPFNSEQEKHVVSVTQAVPGGNAESGNGSNGGVWRKRIRGPDYATTFLTQFETLAGREWKILRR
jgi:ABC-type multidrug transport system ATPase subunit